MAVVSDWRHCSTSAPVPGYCSMPGLMVNVWTGEHYLARCGSARPSRCEWCAERHRGDVAAVGRSGWADRMADRGYWVTLTAPGVGVLPWDRARCTHSAGVDCSGSIGCVVEADALARWHDALPAAWTHFMTDLRRLLNPGVTGPLDSMPVQVEFFKTYEPQLRGALHVHSMMRVAGVVTDRRFRAAFRLAAFRNGFGRSIDCVMVDISQSIEAARKAGYCAKYASKNADALPAVRRINSTTGEISHGGLRAWSSSRHWGDSMKLVKDRRACWWAGGTGGGVRSGGLPGAPAGDGVALDSYQEIYASVAGFAAPSVAGVPVLV